MSPSLQLFVPCHIHCFSEFCLEYCLHRWDRITVIITAFIKRNLDTEKLDKISNCIPAGFVDYQFSLFTTPAKERPITSDAYTTHYLCPYNISCRANETLTIYTEVIKALIAWANSCFVISVCLYAMPVNSYFIGLRSFTWENGCANVRIIPLHSSNYWVNEYSKPIQINNYGEW